MRLATLLEGAGMFIFSSAISKQSILLLRCFKAVKLDKYVELWQCMNLIHCRFNRWKTFTFEHFKNPIRLIELYQFEMSTHKLLISL